MHRPARIREIRQPLDDVDPVGEDADFAGTDLRRLVMEPVQQVFQRVGALGQQIHAGHGGCAFEGMNGPAHAAQEFPQLRSKDTGMLNPQFEAVQRIVDGDEMFVALGTEDFQQELLVLPHRRLFRRQLLRFFAHRLPGRDRLFVPGGFLLPIRDDLRICRQVGFAELVEEEHRGVIRRRDLEDIFLERKIPVGRSIGIRRR